MYINSVVITSLLRNEIHKAFFLSWYHSPLCLTAFRSSFLCDSIFKFFLSISNFFFFSAMASSTFSPTHPKIVPPNPTPTEFVVPNFSAMNLNSSSSSISSITIQNISCMVPTKLKRDNYLVWKALFAPIFRRYKLIDIVDGSELSPPPYLLDQNGRTTGIPNPAYEAWFEKDQNFLFWLNSTLSKEIIMFTVGVTSSRIFGLILKIDLEVYLLLIFINFDLVYILYTKVTFRFLSMSICNASKVFPMH